MSKSSVEEQNVENELINRQKVRIMRQIGWVVILKRFKFQGLNSHRADWENCDKDPVKVAKGWISENRDV